MGVNVYPPVSGTSSKLVGKSGVATCLNLGFASVTAPNSTYGSWVQVTASTASEYYLVGLLVYISGFGSAAYGSIRIGVGSAGSEAQVCELGWHNAGLSQTAGQYVQVPVPPRVAAGSRVALAAFNQSATGSVTLLTAVTAATFANVDGN